MHHDSLPRGGRDGRRAAIGGLAASAAVHAALFSVVTFGAVAPAAERALPARADAFADAAAIHLIPLSDASAAAAYDPRPRPGDTGQGSAAAPPEAAAEPAVSAADASAPDASAPPVLLTYRESAPSPLLLAGLVDSPEGAAPAARPVGYTPGGVRKAKLGWSGRESDRPAGERHAGSGLRAGVGGGHCPVRPPRRGGLGL